MHEDSSIHRTQSSFSRPCSRWPSPSDQRQLKATSPKNEQELIAILRSDAPEAEKALACKHLAVYGSSEAVPELAKLLADEQLASWARIRAGSDSRRGGRRSAAQGDRVAARASCWSARSIRSASAAMPAPSSCLSGRLEDKDADVASAAAVALGRIGNAAAAKSLRQALASAPVEGPLGGRRRLRPLRRAFPGRRQCGRSDEDLRRSPQGRCSPPANAGSDPRSDSRPRARRASRSSSSSSARTTRDCSRSRLSTAREFPGREVDEALAAELERAFPERAALVIVAMADRNETVDLAAVLKAASSGPKPGPPGGHRRPGTRGKRDVLWPRCWKLPSNPTPSSRQQPKRPWRLCRARPSNKDIVARLAKAEGKTIRC